MAGWPLSQVATPMTPRRVGSERISRRKTIAASLRYARLSNMPGVPCVRPSHGSVQKPAKGMHAELARVPAPRPPSAARPPSGRCDSRARRAAVGRADAAEGAEEQELRRGPSCCGSQPMPASCVQPNRSPLGRLPQHRVGDRQRTRRDPARRSGSRRRDGSAASKKRGVIASPRPASRRTGTRRTSTPQLATTSASAGEPGCERAGRRRERS